MDFDFNSLLAFIIFGITIGVVYGIVALGISLIYSGLDIVHFAHGEIYMFGAFIGLFFSQIVGVPYPFAIIGAMIFAALLGMGIERVFYRRLTQAGGGYTVAGMGMIICGFGMSVALMNVAFLIWGAGAEPFPCQSGYASAIRRYFHPTKLCVDCSCVDVADGGAELFYPKYKAWFGSESSCSQ